MNCTEPHSCWPITFKFSLVHLFISASMSSSFELFCFVCNSNLVKPSLQISEWFTNYIVWQWNVDKESCQEVNIAFNENGFVCLSNLLSDLSGNTLVPYISSPTPYAPPPAPPLCLYPLTSPLTFRLYLLVCTVA